MTTNPSSQSAISFPNFHPTPGLPAYYDEQAQSWQVFRYAQVQRVLSDFATFSSRRGKLATNDEGPNTSSLNDLDPPQHQQLRALVMQAFTPRIVATFEPRITHLVNKLLEAVIDRREMDVISDFSALLPLIVIAEILGVPVSDHHYLRKLSDASIPMVTPAAAKARYEMWDYFATLVKQRQRLPGQNLISNMIEAQIDGQRLTTSELASLCCLLLIAGNETTKTWIGNAMACFDQHPDALRQVQEEPDLLSTALEEVLRYLPPVTSFPRVAAIDTVIDGQQIKAGQWIIPHIDAANRDETQFPDPETFDIRRSPNRHLTFGHGIHFCLGAPLARLEARIALSIMFGRLTEIERVRSVPLETIVTPLGYKFKHFPITFKRK